MTRRIRLNDNAVWVIPDGVNPVWALIDAWNIRRGSPNPIPTPVARDPVTGQIDYAALRKLCDGPIEDTY